MNNLQIWLEMNEEKNRLALELYTHQLMCDDWDKERFIHECKRYLENGALSKHVKRAASNRGNVVSLSDRKPGLGSRPNYFDGDLA